MFSQRLKQLGLDQHLVLEGDEYQRRMATDLRTLVFRYLQGSLTDIEGNLIPDGPVVTKLRDNLRKIGGLDKFMQEQSPDKAWATDVELVLLAELLDCSLVAEFPEEKTTAVLYTSATASAPVIAVANTKKTHWDAILNGEIDPVLHDKNCGYNTIAKGIAACHRLQNNRDSRYNAAIEQYRKDEAHFTTVYDELKKTDPKKYAEVMAQIASDYQYALRIALADLPGIQGKASKERVVPFSLFPQKTLPDKTTTSTTTREHKHTFNR